MICISKIRACALALCMVLLPDGYDPKPVERPQAPGRGNAEVIVVPDAARIERDAFIADRFTAEGQSVTYTLQARANELSLLTLDTVGYARGWQSEAQVRIRRAEGGEVIAERTREGGTVYRMFFPFQAPADGEYLVELSCPTQYFRYVLTRHSQFRTRGLEPIAVGERSLLHGYLRDPETDVARYGLELAEGEEVLLRVLSDEMPARQQDYGRRGKAAARGDLEVLRGETLPDVVKAGRGGAARGATVGDHPDYFLRVMRGGVECVTATPFARFRAREAGGYVVEVVANGAGEGGFFELGVERSPVMVAGKGFVDDAEGDAVLGVELQFFREPGLEFFGRVTTDSEGLWGLDLAAGSYTVFLQGRAGELVSVRTTVDGERETNFIYGGRESVGDEGDGPMDR